MSASTISLILNLVLLFFVLVGFLAGVVRGAKKSGLRTGWLVGLLVVFFLVSPLISVLVQGIYIAPLGNTIGGFVEAAIMDVPEIADVYANNAAVQELVGKLPTLLINLIVMFVLVLVGILISYIGYLISKAIHMKKPKRTVEDEKYYTVKNGRPVLITPKQPKEKKYRWWGGLIGAIGGFAVCVCLFLPFTGTVRTVMQYVDTTESAPVASAAESAPNKSSFAYPEVSAQIKKLVGEDVIGYLDAIQNSWLVKAAGVANIDLALYDTISSVNVAGQKVTLRSEIRTVAEITETAMYVQKMLDANGGIDWKNLDFDRLSRTVDAVLGSGIVMGVGVDLLEQIVEKAATETYLDDLVADGQLDAETAKYLKVLVKELQTSKALNGNTLIGHVQSDLKAALNVMRAVCESGLIYAVTEAETFNAATAQEMMDCLKGKSKSSVLENHDYLQDITDSIFSSLTLRAAFVGGANVALDMAAEEMNAILKADGQDVGGANAVAFDAVVQKDFDWNAFKTSLTSILNTAISLGEIAVQIADSEDYVVEAKNQLKLGKGQEALDALALVLDNVASSQILTNTERNINNFDLALDYMANYSKVSEYANLSRLKNTNWQTEVLPYKEILTALTPFLAAEDWAEYNYKTLNYDLLLANQSFASAFGGNVAYAAKVSGIKTLIGAEENSALAKVISTLFGDAVSVRDLQGTLTTLTDAALTLAKAGVGEFVVAEDKNAAVVNDFVDGLLTVPTGQANSNLVVALNKLFAETKLLDVYHTYMNTVLEGLAEDYPELGTIEKPSSWTAWRQHATNTLTGTIEKLVKVCQSLQIEDFEPLKDQGAKNIVFDVLLTEDFAGANGNAQKLGEVLDVLTNSPMLTTSYEGANKNVVREILYKNLADYADIVDREIILSTTDLAFWKTELMGLATALVKLDTTNAYATGNQTLLDVLFDKGAEELKNCEGFKALTSEEKETILTPIFESKLLKPATTKLLQEVEKAVGEAFDNTFVGSILGDVDLTGQMDTVITVLEGAQDISDMFTEGEEITLETVLDKTIGEGADQKTGEEVITGIMDTIQNNQEGVFGSVYETAFDYVQTTYPNLDALQDVGQGAVTKDNVVWADVIAEIRAQLGE